MGFKQDDYSTDLSQRDVRYAHALGLSRGSIFGLLRILLFLLLDAVMVTIAWVTAKYISDIVPQWGVVGIALIPNEGRGPGLLLPIITINTVLLVAAKLYGSRFQRRSYLTLIITLSLSQCLIVVIQFLYQPDLPFSRSTFLMGFLFTILLILVGRWGAEGLITLLRRRGSPAQNYAGGPWARYGAGAVVNRINQQERI